jgi:hypothetical protein
MVNAIAAHKDELKKLLENLSGDTAVSAITFVALVDAYITRLDANCPDISARVNPPPAQIDGELTYGTNIDSELRTLLRATYSFRTPRRAFPKISRCGPQASSSQSQPIRDELFGRLPASAAQRPLSGGGRKLTVK